MRRFPIAPEACDVAVALATGLLRIPPPTGPSWSAAFNEALIGLVGLAPVCAGAVAWLVLDHYQRRGIGTLAASSPRGAAGGRRPRSRSGPRR